MYTTNSVISLTPELWDTLNEQRKTAPLAQYIIDDLTTSDTKFCLKRRAAA